MNCPSCNSTYTELSNTKEDIHKTTYYYKCLSCGHTFTRVSNKACPTGKKLMTVYGGFCNYSDIDSDHVAEISTTANNTLYIKQKTQHIGQSAEYRDTTVIPVFKAKGGNYGYTLDYNSFSWMNDPKGTLFSVKKIELNDELLASAQQSEAMRIALKGDVLRSPQNSDVVLRDIASWLNNALSPYKTSSQGSPAPAQGGAGCYVATAVYGSYDCPEVWTLRRYRDNTLAESRCGRAFIKAYYAISPTLVKWFGETEWFKKLWRGRLDRMVKTLQEKGVESTPYEDKNW